MWAIAREWGLEGREHLSSPVSFRIKLYFSDSVGTADFLYTLALQIDPQEPRIDEMWEQSDHIETLGRLRQRLVAQRRSQAIAALEAPTDKEQSERVACFARVQTEIDAVDAALGDEKNPPAIIYENLAHLDRD